MGYGIDILNNIHANASSEYADTIPVATAANFAEIGTYLETYDALANEFHTALWNKIGKTLIETAIAENRLERFKCGKAKPLDIESIFVDMAKGAYTYDPEGKDVLARIKDDNVKAIYHRLNRQDTYDMTIGDLDFSRVFRSEATFESFITSKFNALYARATDDEWVFMKNCFATYDGYFNVQVAPITDENAPETTKDFLKAIRKMVMRLSFAKRDFNKMKAKTKTDPEKLVLLINADILAEIDVEVLSKAMNMGKTDIQIDIIPMDDFGTLANTYALMVDESFYKCWDTLSKMEPARNPKGLFTNWFYHIQQIHAISTFKNAVRFTTDTVNA